MKISVVVPALNEEKNIARVIKILKACTLVDEIIVVDNNSTDSTNEIAKSLGVKTILCKKRGKGYAMEMGLKESTGSIVVFVDGDICNYKKGFIEDLVSPILNQKADFVKSSFTREGGRVTELVAKPLLEIAYPKLLKFDQPLSGIIAGKKRLFEKITFDKDYGVDVGILIDVYNLKAKIKEVNIGKIRNDSQDWKALIKMAREVSYAIIKRVDSNRLLMLKNLDNKNFKIKTTI